MAKKTSSTTRSKRSASKRKRPSQSVKSRRSSPATEAKVVDRDPSLIFRQLLEISLLDTHKWNKIIDHYCSEIKRGEDVRERFVSELSPSDAADIEDLRFIFEVAERFENDLELVKNIVALRRAGAINALQDLALMDVLELDEALHGVKRNGGEATRLSRKATIDKRDIDTTAKRIAENLDGIFPSASIFRQLGREITVELNGSELPTRKSQRKKTASLDHLTKKKTSLEDARIEAISRREATIFQGVTPTMLRRQNKKSVGDTSSAVTIVNPARKELVAFYKNAPSFDLQRDSVDGFLAGQRAAAVEQVEDENRLRTNLKRLQRVCRIASRYEQMEALLAEGFDSARAVTSMTPVAFNEKLAQSLGGVAEADKIYAKAQLIDSTINFFITAARTASTMESPSTPSSIRIMPVISQLFYSLDFFDCDHDESVYGISSYLVDLLQFLRRSGRPFVLDTLLQRRPDLVNLQLTKENATIRIPYIDLVNEILECFVAHGQIDDSAAHANDDGVADDSGATPQFINFKAYELLRNAVHTQKLPFDRSREIARAYLSHLGTSLPAIMRICRSEFDSGDTSLRDDIAIAQEHLEISQVEYELLVATSDTPVWRLYGFDPFAELTITDDFLRDWREQCRCVSEFLRRTEISYDELVELLKTRFLNPHQYLGTLPSSAIVLYSAKGTYDDLETLFLSYPDGKGDIPETTWAKIIRFLRLWKKLGWTLHEVDLAIQVLGISGDAFDRRLFIELSAIKRLQVDLGLPVVQLLSFWGNVDTKGNNSLYHEIFLKGTISSSAHAAFRLNVEGSQLEYANTPLVDYLPALAGALGVNVETLSAICEILGINLTTAFYTLETLSNFYRHLLLARALSFTAYEWASILAFTGKNPFADRSPSATLSFVEDVRRLHRGRSTVATYDFLFRHVAGFQAPAMPSTQTAKPLLSHLQLGLKKIYFDTMPVSDATDETLRRGLGMAIDNTQIEKACAIIDGSSSIGTEEKTRFFDLYLRPFLSSDQDKVYMLDHSFSDPDNLDIRKRRDYVIPRLMQYLRDRQCRDLVTEVIGDAVGLDSATTRHLLENILSAQTDSTKPAMADFLSLIGDGLLAVYTPAHQNDITQLERIDATIDFVWTRDTLPLQGQEAFVASWSGKILPLCTELYTFHVQSSGAAKVFIDHNPLVATAGGEADVNAAIALSAGRLYDIEIEYRQDGIPSPDDALPLSRFRLVWSSVSTPKQTVPQSQLYSGRSFVPADGLSATYFDQVDFTDPILTRVDPVVDFDWRKPWPVPERIKPEHFSVRWRGFLVPKISDTYTIFTLTDDGVRLWIDGKLLIDQWKDQPATEYFVSLWLEEEKFHEVTLEYYQRDYDGIARLSWSSASVPKSIIPADVLYINRPENTDTPPPNGINAVYFDTMDLNGITIERIDSTIDFDWGVPWVAPGLVCRTFSVQWCGKIKPSHSEPYTFTVLADDGVQLWIDNICRIDELKNQSATEYRTTLDLQAGKLYDIRIRYYQDLFDAVVRLSWSSPSTPLQVVPQTNLYSGAPFDLQDRFVESYTRFLKIALAINLLQMNPDEVRYFTSKDDDTLTKLINGLPHHRTDPQAIDRRAPALVSLWLRLADYCSFREAMALPAEELIAIVTAASVDEALSRMAASVSWSHEVLRFLAGTDALALDIDTIRSGNALARLKGVFDICERLGISAHRLHAWARCPMTDALAEEIVQSVKSKYGEQQWRKTAGAINNILREKQRDALVSYVLANPKIQQQGIHTADQLFEYFLIDVQHGPETLTTRAHQAVSSVQLFVQRCLMNLEIDVAPSRIPAQEWQWMRRYRTWEANRKIFLYPENWIEPDQRSDKSALFREFEERIAQGDITAKTAELAVRGYLEQLNSIAVLDIRGFYRQPVDNFDVFHFVARTPLIPYRYYYCSYDGRFRQWKTWDAIDAGINADHILPLAWNSRFFVFWPEFAEKAIESDQVLNGGSRARKTKEISLSWTEYINSKWQPKMSSGEAIQVRLWQETTKDQDSTILDSAFYFRVYTDPNEPDEVFIYVLYSPDNIKTSIKHVGTFRISGNHPLVSAVSKTIPDEANSFPPYENVPCCMREVRESEQNLRFIQWISIDESINISTSPLKERANMLASAQSPECRSARNLLPVVFQDSRRVYFCTDTETISPHNDAIVHSLIELCHPYAGIFLQQLLEKGIDGALCSENQRINQTNTGFFDLYTTNSLPMDVDYYVEKVDFDSGPYANYNWELFFHLPLLVADRLSKNQRFAEAQKWFHYIFDPTSLSSADDSPKAAWKFLPFTENTGIERIDRLLRILAGGDPSDTETKLEIERQIALWRNDPFDPHAIARLRIGAYQWTVVMKYIDNLIAWGDQLFNQSTMESVNEATQLYVLARSILGPRPSKSKRPEGEFYAPGGLLGAYYNSADFTGYCIRRIDSQVYFDWSWQEHPLEVPLPSDRFTVRWTGKIFLPDDVYNNSFKIIIEHTGGVRLWIDGQKIIDVWDTEEPESFETSTAGFTAQTLGRFADLALEFSGKRRNARINLKWSFQQLNQHYPYHAPIYSWDLYHPSKKTFQDIGALGPDDKPFVLDAFSNVLIPMENEFPFVGFDSSQIAPQSVCCGMATGLLFGIPHNEELIKRWDLVEDRLFKVRHGMNLQGVTMTLPLYAPPIEPGVLAHARAAGLDIGTILSDSSVPTPHYRFKTTLGKALEMCSELRLRAGALLAAFERRDAEELAALRAVHETSMASLGLEIRAAQIDELGEMAEALMRTREAMDYKIRSLRSREKQNVYEKAEANLFTTAAILSGVGAALKLAASCINSGPDFSAGLAGISSSPVALVKLVGGSKLAKTLQLGGEFSAGLSTTAWYTSRVFSAQGAVERRWEDWNYQANVVEKELANIDRLIAAAQIRQQIAEKELARQQALIANATSAETYLRSKYTNVELYSWMATQLSTLFFQTYQLVYDLAKRAEKAYRFEHGLETSNFIQFGYWDSLRKGLMAPERLYLDLKRLDTAHLHNDKRDLEITKHLSLSAINSYALLLLKETGHCEFETPEVLFDLDFPGHYFRRIKSVALTVKCNGKSTLNMPCTLSLLKSTMRVTTDTVNGYAFREDYEHGNRFLICRAAQQSIACSEAQNDHGVFSFDFCDERYLPFEGAGVIGLWRLELPARFRQFDYSTIEDVILHVSYTARSGGDGFKKKVDDELQNAIGSVLSAYQAAGGALVAACSLRRDFPQEFHRFLLEPENGVHSAAFSLRADHFPFYTQDKPLVALQARLAVTLKHTAGEEIALSINGGKLNNLGIIEGCDSLRVADFDAAGDPGTEWIVSNAGVSETGESRVSDLPPELVSAIEDIVMFLSYQFA